MAIHFKNVEIISNTKLMERMGFPENYMDIINL